jgi:hydroxyacylglutathione hydrolase
MRRLAEDLFHIPLLPRNAVNAYLLGDVLVDAGTVLHGDLVVKAVAGHAVRAHLVTHSDLDHAGGSKHVCDALGVPLWCGAADADSVERGRAEHARNPVALLTSPVGRFPAVTVTRRLQEGDEVGPGFTVLDVPGHTAGHIALWREGDRTLVCGDVFMNMDVFTTRAGLHEPLRFWTPDRRANRAAARRLAELEPELVLFGHGPPLRDPAKLLEFAGSLQD